MTPSSATVSPAFRKLAVRAVLTIFLFIFVYLLLFALSIGLTVFCGWVAVLMISLQPGVITFGLGIGLFCMGLMITYFLLKFIFSRHKVDRSHLMEITREEEPQLFAMIGEIVQEVKTEFPKKIYLSSAVNAAVFYDSSFWSMFFPIRKNLEIGLGLANSVTLLELKAILAHEFGHFSQRSLKLGSYVYNVNKVIYNMLYDNESYQRRVSHLANASGYIAFFSHIAIGTVQGIQWLMKKIYNVVNVTYMGLSREMEFHADAVAAHIAGSRPLITALLRFELSDAALNRVLGFYDSRYQQSVIPVNVYRQQRWIMECLSLENDLPLAGGLPLLTEAHYDRYSKSKLVIKNQWASHPGTEEQITALNKLNIYKEEEGAVPANSIFRDVLKTQEAITAGIFAAVTFPATTVQEDEAAFKEAYLKEYPLYIHPDVFNGYYNCWNPLAYQPDENIPLLPRRRRALFSDDMVKLTWSLPILENDKATLYQLTIAEHGIKTFDYDGVKYSMDNIYTLMAHLDGIIAETRATLEDHDAIVHAYFYRQASMSGRYQEWNNLYRNYAQAELQMEARLALYMALLEATGFMQEHLPYAQIELRLPAVKEAEQAFKAQLAVMLEEEAYQQVLLPQRDLFAKYVSMNDAYFSGKSYNDDAVQLLYTTLGVYPAVLANGRNSAKLAWLDICADLMKWDVPVPVPVAGGQHENSEGEQPMKTLTIEYYSRRPSIEELDALQKETGIQFPPYLTTFLLQYGGTEVEERYWDAHLMISNFLLPYGKNDTSMDQAFKYVRNEEYIGRNDLVPFAADISGRPVYLSVGAADYGAVYADRVGIMPVEEALVKVADSFEMFIGGLCFDPES